MNATFGEFRNSSIDLDEKSPFLSFLTDDGVLLPQNDLENQFVIYQFNTNMDGPSILDMSEVIPSKSGSDDKPDALARVQLASFNIGQDEYTKWYEGNNKIRFR